MQRRKGVGRHLRVRGRKRPEQSGFPGVRISDQAGIGDHAQLEKEPPLFTRRALGILPRRAIARAFEMNIAPATATALPKQKFRLRLIQIDKQFEVFRLHLAPAQGLFLFSTNFKGS